MFEGFSREATYITSVGRTLFSLRHVKPDSPVTIVDVVENHARRTPQATAILYQDREVSYAALDENANRYAHWGEANGIRRGDVVALLMENRPEYLFAWLGLLKLGAVIALINTNLRGAPLAHSIGISEARHVVLGSELAGNYAEAKPLMDNPPVAWATGAPVLGCEDLDAALASSSPAPADPKLRDGVTCKDKAFYVYTSGTTGLPKAANMTHMRMLFMMYGFAAGLNAKASHRMYNVLPLYHSSGGICAVGVAFLPGGTLVLRRKFSVNEFWDDCTKYRPTFFQYIGELCRYLLNAPPNPNERAHHLQAITGNGLRPEIWTPFQERFAIPKIVEFYGATEGNVSMLNYDGKVGSVGRIPHYMRNLIVTRIVRFDIDRETPVRGPDGFCIECADGEVGEAIGEIRDEPGRGFDGYSRKADTEKKILRDVFAKGDAWFRTGDLMKEDEYGYFYFVDRIGDTFRWKGENVATSEVSEALGVVPGVLEANVYGVSVPGQDGRAGMAALVVEPDFDVSTLAEKLGRNLAPFARPVFVRLQPEMEVTGTFKQRKVELVREGFDPSTTPDPVYVLDADTLRYVPLDKDRFDAIQAGKMKL